MPAATAYPTAGGVGGCRAPATTTPTGRNIRADRRGRRGRALRPGQPPADGAVEQDVGGPAGRGEQRQSPMPEVVGRRAAGASARPRPPRRPARSTSVQPAAGRRPGRPPAGRGTPASPPGRARSGRWRCTATGSWSPNTAASSSTGHHCGQLNDRRRGRPTASSTTAATYWRTATTPTGPMHREGQASRSPRRAGWTGRCRASRRRRPGRGAGPASGQPRPARRAGR